MVSHKRFQKETKSLYLIGKLFWGAFLFLSLLHCSIDKPSVPTWDLKLSLPLLSEHYDMVELIDKIDEPYLEVDSLGNPSFCFEENLDTIRLVDKLRCDPIIVNYKDTLGIITIYPSESRQMVFYVTEFYDGPPGDVPPCSATIEQDLDTLSTFSEVTVQEAFTTLTVSNHLGLDLDSVQMKIIDKNNLDTLETVTFPTGIRNGDLNTRSITFAHKTFSNRLAIKFSAFTLGGELDSLEGKYLSLDFTIDSLRIIQGIAEVPAFELTEEEIVTLPTSSIIDSAQIKSGELSLTLCNFTNLPADLQIDFPQLQRDDQILSVIHHLQASTQSEINLVLNGYALKPEGGNEVAIQTTVSLSGSDGALTSFCSSDSFSVSVNLGQTTFSQICGIIEPTLVEIDQITRELDIPPGFESAYLTSASLNMEIHNGVDLPADLSLDIQGDKGQDLNLQAQVEAGGPFGTSITSVFVDQLQTLLSPVPQRITVTGEAVCGDGQSYGMVKEKDFLFGKVFVSSPLELILDSCQIQIDQSSDQVDDDLKELIQEQINFGKVILKIENHLPLKARAKIFFSGDQGDLFSNPDLTIGPIEVPAGVLGYYGSVEGSNSSVTEIDLTYHQLQVFTNSPFYMAGSIDFPGTYGETIKASTGDFITIASYLELDVKNQKE